MDLAFRALADSNRRTIIQLLAVSPRTVSELLEHFRFSQPALSRHLRILREAGLVDADDDGRFRRYRLVGAALGDMAAWLQHYRRFWTGKLDTLGDVLDAEAKKQRRSQ